MLLVYLLLLSTQSCPMGGAASQAEEFKSLNDDYAHTPLSNAPATAKKRYLKRQESFILSELQLACQQGDITTVKKLLARGHDINEVDKYGRTPLIFTCEKGSHGIATLLLDKNAYVNTAEKRYGHTALIAASMRGSETLVSALLDGGSDIDCVDKNRKSALYHAVEMQHTNVVLSLLAAGANTDLQSNVGRTALLEVRLASK